MPTSQELLEALETRLILGEISEARYDELKAKLLAKLEGDGGSAASGGTTVSDSVIKGDVSSTTGAASVGSVVFNVPGAGASEQQGTEVVGCPLCGRRNDFKQTFRCMKCQRDHLCLEHFVESERICEDCAGVEPGQRAGARAVRDQQEDEELRVDLDFQECLRAILLGKGAVEYLRSAYGSGLDSWKRGAELGWPRAQWLYARCLQEGIGVVKDATEAAHLYRKAAEQGHAEAQAFLGYLYASGEGVPEDLEEAVAWIRKAAEQGSAVGQFWIGMHYFKGLGVPEDKAQAVAWFRKAAEQGDADAQRSLGCCYSNGEGVPKDKAEAVAWYLKAAEQGDAIAQSNLGACYCDGVGVSEDQEEAVAWFRKAAEQGRAYAQLVLGVCYHQGNGVGKDDAEAVKWFSKAAAQGNEQAKKNLRILRP